MQIPALLLWIEAGLIGAAIGSFLNVCITRLPDGESVLVPPSHCPRCSTPIAWRDKVPIASWIALRGRCRSCHEPISGLYPAIELITALVWVAAVFRAGPSWASLSLALFFTLLVGIAATDARTLTIPDEFTLGGLLLGLLLACAPGGITPLRSLAGAALGFSVLYLAGRAGEWWLRKPAMGGGDIKMMAMVGAFLGPAGALLTIFLGALIGTIVFLPLALRTRTLVPFGIFLALGAALTEVWGEVLVRWYLTRLLGW